MTLDGLGRRRLRQRPVREPLRHAQLRTAGARAIPQSGEGEDEGVQLHRGVVQSAPVALGPGVPLTGAVRAGSPRESGMKPRARFSHAAAASKPSGLFAAAHGKLSACIASVHLSTKRGQLLRRDRLSAVAPLTPRPNWLKFVAKGWPGLG